MGTLASAETTNVRRDDPAGRRSRSTRSSRTRSDARSRTSARILLLAAWSTAVLGSLGALFASDAGARSDEAPRPSASCAKHGCVDVVAVNGLVDGIEADFVTDTLEGARRSDGVVAVVLQFDSGGSAVDDDRLDEVAAAIRASDVPVSVWIGPSGSEALGGAAELVQVADSSGIAPGASIGDVGHQRLSTAEFGDLFAGRSAVAMDRVLTGEAAVKAGLVTRFSPTIGEHIVQLDGVETKTRTEDGERRTVPLTTVRFSKLPLSTQLFHTVASPSVAYLLLTIGLGLLLFEFFTAGIGIAGVVGALATVLGAYGVAELPHRGWAIVVLVLSFVALAIDVQAGIPRVWTYVGTVAFAVASLFVMSEFPPTWIALLAGVGGIAIAMFSGMPAMVRTRFSTPTIERDCFVGEHGRVAAADGASLTVTLRDAQWPARSDGSSDPAVGDRIEVTATDGVVLVVAPDAGDGSAV